MLGGKKLLDYTNLFSPNDYKINGKIIYKYFKNKYASLEFRFKNINETSNYLLEEKKHNDLMSEKHKTACNCLSYLEQLLILSSTVTACVSISAFTSLVPVPVDITSSTVGLKIRAITGGIKNIKY